MDCVAAAVKPAAVMTTANVLFRVCAVVKSSLGATALASLTIAACGCSVYEDELLRKPEGGLPPSTDGSNPSRDGATGGDSAVDGGGGASDGLLADVFDAGNDVADTGPSPDGASSDVARTDANVDAPFADVSSDTRADVLPPSDAADARADGSFEDTAPPTDVTVDRDGGSGPTFRVVRVGQGATPLSPGSTAVFIEERTWAGIEIGAPVALPTTASGTQQPLTLSGNAVSEGALSLSNDGRFLTLAGYATGPGVDPVVSSTTIARVVGRISGAGAVDTSTVLGGGAFSGANVRSAASADGAQFWVAGTGGTGGGIWFTALGSGSAEQLVLTPDNVRWLHVSSGQLFGTSGVAPMTGVFGVGIGLPTTGEQLALPLLGMPLAGMSPYSFAFFDRSTAVAGPDTLYVADDRSPNSDGSGGGVQKWTFDGSSWTRVATFSTVNASPTSAAFRGLAGIVTGANVSIVASTAEADANRLVVFIDDGSASPVGQVIAKAAANTAFRGIALSPGN